MKAAENEQKGQVRLFLNHSGQDLLFSRDFSAEELRGRRREIARRAGADAFMLIPGAPLQPGHRASQDATFYYFTGLDVLNSFLLIDGRDGRNTVSALC